jgi:hypothetical protein
MSRVVDKKRTIKVDRFNRDAPVPKDEDSGKFITAFSDASYQPRTRCYGVGIWIKSTEGTHTLGFGGRCDSALEAERQGVGYIVNFTKSLEIKNKIVVIQCDCLTALETLDVKPLYEAGAVYVKLKHVKGHSDRDTNRTKVNVWCDKIAKEERLKFEQQHRRTL